MSWDVKAFRQWYYGQLIDYNIRQSFFGKSYTKCGGETSLKPSAYLWINSLNFYSLLYMPRWRPSKYIEAKLHTTGSYLTSIKPLLKIELRLKKIKTILHVPFSPKFLKKNTLVIFYYLTKFLCLTAFFN